MAKRTSEMPAVFVDRLSVRVGASLEEVERHLLHATLASVGGNQARAAQILGIDAKTVYRWLKRAAKGEAAAGVAMGQSK